MSIRSPAEGQPLGQTQPPRVSACNIFAFVKKALSSLFGWMAAQPPVPAATIATQEAPAAAAVAAAALVQAAGQPAVQIPPAAQAAVAAEDPHVASLPAAAALVPRDWSALRDEYIARVQYNCFLFPEVMRDLVRLQASADLIREVSLIAVKKFSLALEHVPSSLLGDYGIVSEAVKQNGWALRYADQSLRANREIVLEAVKQNGGTLRFADPSLRANREIVLEAVKQNGEALEYADPSLKRDHGIVLEAMKQRLNIFMYADTSLKANHSFILEAVKQNGCALGFADPSLRANREIVLAAVKQSGRALQFADQSLRANREIVLEAVKQNGEALEYADPSLISNREIVLAAVKQYGCALGFADPSLRANREIVLEAVKESGWALRFADPSLRANREIVLEAVKQNGLALQYADQSLRADQEFVLAAFKRDGSVLGFADPSLRRDRSFILEAVKQDGWALRFADPSLQANREIVLEAVKQNGWALRFADPSLQADREIVLEAVKQNGEALQYAPLELRRSPAFLLEAIKQNGEALLYAPLELRTYPDFLGSLRGLFEPGSQFTFDGKKRLFMTLCRLDMVELKTAIITAAIAHLVSVQRTFTEEDLQSLIKELDLLGNFSLMADFLFHPLIPSLLNTLPRDFAENKDLRIAWALSNLYLNQLDPHLIPAFLRAIDSDKKAFKNRSNLKVLLGFLNQFKDNKAQASPRRERGAAIVRHIVTLFKQHADAKRAPAQAKRGGATTTAASQKIDILFDRMAILTIYDQCDLSDSIDLTRDTPALQDALLDRFIPEDLSPAAGAAAAAAAASSSSSSAPNLRANLKEAIIKSPHPAALLHYLTTLQREGQLVPGKPGFELLQRIAMGDFKERRHTTCSHPAMTPAMRARWEASTSAVQVAGQSLTAVDSEDWEDLLFCGTGIFGSCLNCKGSFEQNAGLLGICLDGKIRMATVKNANGVIIARCIMRLTVDQAGKTCLFKENIYPARYERPSEADAYARQVASALNTLVRGKAAAMGVALYTYASDAAAATSGVELSTPPTIAGFDYSDVNPGGAIASFQFPRVHRLYPPG